MTPEGDQSLRELTFLSFLEVEVINLTKSPCPGGAILSSHIKYIYIYNGLIEGSLEVKLPTIWTDEKQSREEAERRERLEERRVEEKE